MGYILLGMRQHPTPTTERFKTVTKWQLLVGGGLLVHLESSISVSICTMATERPERAPPSMCIQIVGTPVAGCIGVRKTSSGLYSAFCSVPVTQPDGQVMSGVCARRHHRSCLYICLIPVPRLESVGFVAAISTTQRWQERPGTASPSASCRTPKRITWRHHIMQRCGGASRMTLSEMVLLGGISPTWPIPCDLPLL